MFNWKNEKQLIGIKVSWGDVITQMFDGGVCTFGTKSFGIILYRQTAVLFEWITNTKRREQKIELQMVQSYVKMPAFSWCSLKYTLSTLKFSKQGRLPLLQNAKAFSNQSPDFMEP